MSIYDRKDTHIRHSETRITTQKIKANRSSNPKHNKSIKDPHPKIPEKEKRKSSIENEDFDRQNPGSASKIRSQELSNR